MNPNTLLIILNIAFVVILALGFLTGLKGVKKSGIDLAVFVGSFILAILITPLITKAVLNINIYVDGKSTTISNYIISLITAQTGSLVTSGSSTESLISNVPVMVGNLVVFMVLLIVIDILAQIITSIVFAVTKKRKKKKNAISKSAPSYVSATGNVKYVREEKPKKYRLAGGLVGTVHALLFVVALLIPIKGVTSTVASLANQVEPEPAVVTYAETEPNYTPVAKYIRQAISEQYLDLVFAVDNSALFKVTGALDINSFMFNSLASCKVDGKKIVLTAEIDSATTLVNQLDYIQNIDIKTAEGLKSVDFERLSLTLDSLFNSEIVKTLLDDIAKNLLDWTTADEMPELTGEIGNLVKDVREKVSQDANLKDLLLKTKQIVNSKQFVSNFLKDELDIILNVADIAVNSTIIDPIMSEDKTNLISTLLTELGKDNNALANNLLSNIFDSEIINLGLLYGTNFGIDFVNDYFATIENAVTVSKINYVNDDIKYNKADLTEIITTILDIYKDYTEVNLDNIVSTPEVLVTANFNSNVKNLGKIVDKVKGLEVLNQSGSFGKIIDNAKLLAITFGEETLNFVDIIDLDLLKVKEFSVETDFETLTPAIRELLTMKFIDEGGNQISSIEQITKEGITETVKKMSKDQISAILTPLANSDLFKPLNVMLINTINNEVKKTIGGNIVELPDDIDLSNQIDNIVNVIDDVKTLLPALEEIGSGTKSLDDVIKDTATNNSDTVVSLLNNLQDNANNNGENGAFTGVYNAMLSYIKDDASGLTDISQIIDANTVIDGEKSVIDWQSVINQYLGK